MFKFHASADSIARIDHDAPQRQLASILTNLDHSKQVSPDAIILRLVAVRSLKDSEGVWHHEYRLETYDPYGIEGDEEEEGC